MINKNTQYNEFQNDSRIGFQSSDIVWVSGWRSSFKTEVIVGFWGRSQILRRGSRSDYQGSGFTIRVDGQVSGLRLGLRLCFETGVRVKFWERVRGRVGIWVGFLETWPHPNSRPWLWNPTLNSRPVTWPRALNSTLTSFPTPKPRPWSRSQSRNLTPIPVSKPVPDPSPETRLQSWDHELNFNILKV